MQHCLSNTLGLTSLLLLLTGAQVSSAANKRVAVPDAASLKKAEQGVREVYGNQITAARSASEKTDLAKKFIDVGFEIKNDADSQYVLLDNARQLAIDAGELPTAIRATATIALTFKVDEFELRADTLNALIAKGKALYEVTRAAVQSIYDALGLDELEHAKTFATIAFTGARLARHQGLMRYAGVIRSEMPRVAAARENWEEALRTLKSEPDNAEANEAAGIYACLIQGNWDGLDQLAKAADADLAAAAKRDLQTKQDGADQLKTGDVWWALADKTAGIKRQRMIYRAKHWYQRAHPTLSGFTAKRIEARIAQEEPPATLLVKKEDRIRISGHITGHERVIISNEKISWQRVVKRYTAPKNVKLNGKSWNYGTPVKRDDLPLDAKFNYDKAKLIKIKSRGTVKLIPSADKIIVDIVDSPSGGANFDLILILPPAP